MYICHHEYNPLLDQQIINVWSFLIFPRLAHNEIKMNYINDIVFQCVEFILLTGYCCKYGQVQRENDTLKDYR